MDRDFLLRLRHWGRGNHAVRTFAKLLMAPFLAPAAARIERKLVRANILCKLRLSFWWMSRGGVRERMWLPMPEIEVRVAWSRQRERALRACQPAVLNSVLLRHQSKLWDYGSDPNPSRLTADPHLTTGASMTATTSHSCKSSAMGL